jgi:hypothetical protein
MVIFHSYVSLPEGNFQNQFAWRFQIYFPFHRKQESLHKQSVLSDNLGVEKKHVLRVVLCTCFVNGFSMFN